MPTELLALAAGVGAFLFGRLVLTPAGSGPAAATPAVDPNADQANASIDYPGVLQGIDQGLGTDATGGIPPASAPVTPPYPLPAPKPPTTTYPIPGLAPPAGSAFVAYATSLVHLWRVSGGIASSISYTAGYRFTAYTAGSITAHLSNGSPITLRRILTGPHAGYFIHYSEAGVTWRAI